MSRTGYLFDPVRVGRLLGRLPDLRRVLRDPTREGVPSVAFPHARKSERQVYRILGNPQYGHLAALLQSRDYCLARGFTQPAILKSRARGTLASALAELGAAEHFLLHGFEVDGGQECAVLSGQHFGQKWGQDIAARA